MTSSDNRGAEVHDTTRSIEGGVPVTIEVVSRGDEPGWLTILVKGEGVQYEDQDESDGIAFSFPEEVARRFLPFVGQAASVVLRVEVIARPTSVPSSR